MDILKKRHTPQNRAPRLLDRRQRRDPSLARRGRRVANGLCAYLLLTSSLAMAWQSCPSPTGYDQATPVQLRPPNSIFSSTATPQPLALRVATPTGLAYRPAELLGWTTSTSACNLSSDSDAPCGAHRVYVPAASVTPREPLVVFLPGSSMEPANHDLILKTAAYAGYRTIGLSYDSTHNVDSLCTPGGTPSSCATDCYASKRDEIILGNDFTPDFTVQRADAIVERLFTLLAQLHVDDMADGVNDYQWDNYFSPVMAVPVPIGVGNINWDQIIVAGFSQGAGHAARMSREYLVHGIIMIDGPGDMCMDGADLVAAPWLNEPDASAGRPRYAAMHGAWFDLFGLDEGAAPASWVAMDVGVDGVASLDVVPQFEPGPWPGPLGKLGNLQFWVQPPAQAAYTWQEPAISGAADGECTAILHPNLPADLSQNHGSMADDRCMPAGLNGGVAVNSPSEAYLFRHYLKRFCYACEAGVCP